MTDRKSTDDQEMSEERKRAKLRAIVDNLQHEIDRVFGSSRRDLEKLKEELNNAFVDQAPDESDKH